VCLLKNQIEIFYDRKTVFQQTELDLILPHILTSISGVIKSLTIMNSLIWALLFWIMMRAENFDNWCNFWLFWQNSDNIVMFVMCKNCLLFHILLHGDFVLTRETY